MNIQIEEEQHELQTYKRKTISLLQQHSINKLNQKVQIQKIDDIQVTQNKLTLLLKQQNTNNIIQLKDQLQQIVNYNKLSIESLVVINSFNRLMQKRLIFKNLSELKDLQLKRVNYFQISTHPIGLIFRGIMLLLQQLNPEKLEEININITPQILIILQKRKNQILPQLNIEYENLKQVRLCLENQLFSENDIIILLILLKCFKKAASLEILNLNFSKCQFEIQDIYKDILEIGFCKFKHLKQLTMELNGLNNLNKAIFNPKYISSIEYLSLNMSSTYLSQTFFSEMLEVIKVQKKLLYLNLNLTKCTLDASKLEQLILVIQQTIISTLLLNLSENIFCQSINSRFNNNIQKDKKNLDTMKLIMSGVLCLGDMNIQPSPDFHILTAFNIQKLYLDLSNTILSYDHLDTLGQELAGQHCKELIIKQLLIKLTISLSNIRVNFDHVIYFTRLLSNCSHLLKISVYLNYNQFDSTQIDLILAAFIQIKLIELNIFFDTEILSKLITHYALNNIYLLKSNLVQKQTQRLLHTRRILVNLMIRLQRFSIDLDIIQFLNDILI